MAESYLGGHTVINLRYEAFKKTLDEGRESISEDVYRLRLKDFRAELVSDKTRFLSELITDFSSKASELLSKGLQYNDAFSIYADDWAVINALASDIYKFKKLHGFID